MSNPLEGLLMAEIQKLVQVEKTLIVTLRMLSGLAEDEVLARSLQDHRFQTELHLKRLTTICEEKSWNSEGYVADTVEAMREEALAALKGSEPGPAADAIILAIARKAENLEIASYDAASTYACQLGDGKVAELLTATLREENTMREKLDRFSLEPKVPNSVPRAQLH